MQIRVGEIDVAYDKHGSGEPVILAHPALLSRGIWERNVDALAAKFTVYAVDLPGHGETEGETLDFTGFADGLCEALGIESAHWIGSSWGGGFVIRAAAATRRCRRIVLAAPTGAPLDEIGRARPHTGKEVGPWQLFRQAFHDKTLATRERFREFSALQDRALPFMRRTREALPEDYAKNGLIAEMKRIVAPTLLVWGAHDATFPPSLAAAFQDAIAGSRLLVYDQSGHFPFLDEPERFNRDVVGFLGDRRSAAEESPV